MADNNAARDLIKELKAKGYTPAPHGANRRKVTAIVGGEKRSVVIPGPKQRTAASAILNARARLRRHLGIDI